MTEKTTFKMIKSSDKYFGEDLAQFGPNNCYFSTTSKTNPLLVKLLLKCWFGIFWSVLWRYFYRQQRWNYVTKKVHLWVPQNSFVSSLPPKADINWDSQNSSESSLKTPEANIIGVCWTETLGGFPKVG